MDDNEITMKFKHKITVVVITVLAALVGFICIVFGTVYDAISGNLIIQLIGVILFMVSILVNSITWRCPKCKKSLPRRVPIKHINYCCNCNTKLK